LTFKYQKNLVTYLRYQRSDLILETSQLALSPAILQDYSSKLLQIVQKLRVGYIDGSLQQNVCHSEVLALTESMNPFYVLVEIERIASCGILQSYS
jgi:hypothetical protein